MNKKPFYSRLLKYYAGAAESLRQVNNGASIFENIADIGSSRELTYEMFLRQHLPSGCRVTRGGFIFGLDGSESAQMDIIVSSDSTLRYDLMNADDRGKTFACVDGTIAAISIKSTLTKESLRDAFINVASIPAHDLNGTIHGKNPQVEFPSFEHWPLKMVFAHNSKLSVQEAMSEFSRFYEKNPQIPDGRKIDIIHSLDSIFLSRTSDRGFGLLRWFEGGEDVHPAISLAKTICQIQQNLLQSRQIFYDYESMTQQLLFEFVRQSNEKMDDGR